MNVRRAVLLIGLLACSRVSSVSAHDFWLQPSAYWVRPDVLTPLTLHAMMKADPGLIEVGGHAYLAGLVQAAPALPNVRDLARILHDLAEVAAARKPNCCAVLHTG